MKKIVFGAFLASMLLSFTACGGGGSSTRTVVALSDKVLSGIGVDGYIYGGRACLDLNLNGACDTDEPTSPTDNQGKFILDIEPSHQLHGNYSTAPIIVVGGKDLDTGKDFIGIMKAQFDGNVKDIVVSPLTTLVKAITDNSGKTQEEAIEAVANALGLNEEDILKDPVALFNDNPAVAKAAISIQKSIELLTQANITASGNTITMTEAFNTVYEQLSNATLAVAEDDNAIKSLTTIIEDANLTGAAAEVTDAVKIIVNGINDSDSNLELEDLARLNDAKVEDVKTLIITKVSNDEEVEIEDVENTIDSSETNPRALKIKQILEDIDATDSQINDVMALVTIEFLVDDIITITAENIATAIKESGNDTLLIVVTKLGYPDEDTTTETECQNVNPITGACEDTTTTTPTETESTETESTETECQNVNPITGACEDTTTTTPTETEPTETECQNVNPITGTCEDTTTTTPTETECQNVNPITGTCED